MRKTQNISFQPEEWERVRKIAVLKSMTISEYVRSCVRRDWENA